MNQPLPPATKKSASRTLARQLGLFDATMIVMGGIIGAGIFINPHVVARQVRTPALILGAWAAGGLIALLGAFIYAELAARRSDVGGQYAYLRDAYHPSLAFVYGWTLLLVTQTGGMAAVAITFANYFLELTRLPATDASAALVAAVALALLTLVNCLGVRAGSTAQNILMVLKLAAIAALVIVGLLVTGTPPPAPQTPLPPPPSIIMGFGAALIPVMFAYGGWQTSSFIAGELRQPKRDLPRGLLLGVLGVVVVYLAVNFVCVYALGVEGLASTQTPASLVMRLALGDRGAQLIAVGIAISTLGFLSQGMLTTPRVYFAMAEDGLFFKGVARLNAANVPVVAIALQGVFAIIIALSGRYEQILNYVVSVDFIFFGLTATCIFIFRRRARQTDDQATSFRIPGHPITTILFVAACWTVVATTIYQAPRNSFIGLAIMLTGLPVYLLWRKSRVRQGDRGQGAGDGEEEV